MVSGIPGSVERYARDIQAVMKAKGLVSLQAIFEEGVAAGKVLAGAVLEELDESSYKEVQARMTGFIVGREEIIVAEPSAEFFLRLAREKGTKADRDFFEALKKTYPESIWPVYIVQQVDWGGCRAFGKGELADTYRAWLAFRSAHPKSYSSAVAKELKGIEDALESACACQGEQDVRRELQALISRCPGSRAARLATERLKAIRRGTSGIHFSCIVSG
jgi:hypothetical protein